MEPIDPSSITASVVSDLIKSAFSVVTKGASAAVRDAWTKIFEDFSPYMKETYNRNRNVRILCQKDRDVDLYDVYVNANFKCGMEKISDRELIQRVNENNNIVVTGNGGAGKTFFMRHLWITLFANPAERSPIFVELRQLNEITNVDIATFIRRTISQNKEMSGDIFSTFCSNGRFCFLLDGFDEVLIEKRESVQKQILDMSSQYPKCSFVVSSRMDKRFAGWQNFSTYDSVPFDLAQVRALISRVPFDEKSKKVFLARLNIEFFRVNESFLSSPLLAIMMMMTFRENMDIPRRMNIFYDQAFSTLYQWHDATKAYSRKKVLDIEEFQRSFGMFCLLSYYKQAFEFTRTEAISFISQSNRVCGIKAKPEDILFDYEESVNMIRQEGLKYVFIHRSFQEYFAALALVRIVPEKFSDFVPIVSSRTEDDVLSLCFEMNRQLVVSEFVSPQYENFKRQGIFDPQLGHAPFELLSRVHTRYEYHLYRYDEEGKKGGSRSRRKGQTVASLGIQIEKDLNIFVECARKLRENKNSRYHIQSIMFEDEIFAAFDNISLVVEPYGEYGVVVKFEPAEIKVTVNEIRSKISEEMTEQAQRKIRDLSPAFERRESALRDEVKLLANWCRSEIDAMQRRGKSLDDILGL